MSQPDVLVIGGGPAGLAAAICAERCGFRTRLLDAARPPVDKACGEGLMPDAVALLDRLGVAIPEGRKRALRGIRWIDGDVVAEATFPAVAGLGVRRLDLHGAMAAAAEAAGVELRWGTAARGLEDGGVRTDGGIERARFLVAADGLRSPLRRAAGLAGPPARRRRFGLTRHFQVTPWTDRVEVHWSDGAEAYVTPLRDDLVGVALIAEVPKPDFDPLLGRFPALAPRLAGAAGLPPDRGAGPLEQRARAVVRGNLALVGDAAGYLDPITGEGMALAFHEAFAVVEAMRRGDLASYAAARRRIVRVPELLTRLVLAIERRPALRRRLVRALARDPRAFDDLLAVLARTAPPAPRLLRALPRLAWRILR